MVATTTQRPQSDSPPPPPDTPPSLLLEPVPAACPAPSLAAPCAAVDIEKATATKSTVTAAAAAAVAEKRTPPDGSTSPVFSSGGRSSTGSTGSTDGGGGPESPVKRLRLAAIDRVDEIVLLLERFSDAIQPKLGLGAEEWRSFLQLAHLAPQCVAAADRRMHSDLIQQLVREYVRNGHATPETLESPAVISAIALAIGGLELHRLGHTGFAAELAKLDQGVLIAEAEVESWRRAAMAQAATQAATAAKQAKGSTAAEQTETPEPTMGRAAAAVEQLEQQSARPAGTVPVEPMQLMRAWLESSSARVRLLHARLAFTGSTALARATFQRLVAGLNALTLAEPAAAPLAPPAGLAGATDNVLLGLLERQVASLDRQTSTAELAYCRAAGRMVTKQRRQVEMLSTRITKCTAEQRRLYSRGLATSPPPVLEGDETVAEEDQAAAAAAAEAAEAELAAALAATMAAAAVALRKAKRTVSESFRQLGKVLAEAEVAGELVRAAVGRRGVEQSGVDGPPAELAEAAQVVADWANECALRIREAKLLVATAPAAVARAAGSDDGGDAAGGPWKMMAAVSSSQHLDQALRPRHRRPGSDAVEPPSEPPVLGMMATAVAGAGGSSRPGRPPSGAQRRPTHRRRGSGGQSGGKPAHRRRGSGGREAKQSPRGTGGVGGGGGAGGVV